MIDYSKKFTILYVDDEPANLQVFKSTFRREYIVLTAQSAQEGLDILNSNRVDLILTDQRMPDVDGVTFLKSVIDTYPDLNRILITAYADFDALKTAVNEARIFQYVQKPWDEEQLRAVIDRALEIYMLKKENERLSKELQVRNEQLEQINNELLYFENLKKDFLKTVSHEIRTPLNGLKGSLQIIKNGKDFDIDTFDDIGSMLESSILKLEKFLLNAELITFLKAKSYTIKNETISIKKLINEVLGKNYTKLKEKEVKVNVDVDDSLTLIADLTLLSKVFNCVIENVAIYSKKGATLSINSKKINNTIIIDFSDDGPGFHGNVLKNAFELFNHGPENLNEQVGLGLALSDIILKQFNASIDISNNQLGGASVTIKFISQ